MNRIKAIIKYQFSDYRHVILIMYLSVYFVYVFSVVSMHFIAGNNNAIRFGSISGLEMASAITIFVIGLNSFKEDFKFFSVNGISRKTQFCSTAAALGILSALFALIDTINCIIFSLSLYYRPWFLQIYGSRFGYSNWENVSSFALTPQILFEDFLWLLFTYFFACMVGYFITTLYYRMNKGLKIAVSIAVPVFLLNGLDALDYYFLNGRINAFLQYFVKTAWGITSGYNPYIAMVSLCVFAAVFAVLAFLLARKAVIKR